MLIIIDKKVAGIVSDKLTREAEKLCGEQCRLLELETDGIVYPAISGHPDIFFFQTAEHLIVAPNLPVSYSEILKGQNIRFKYGLKPAGEGSKPSSFIHYNAARGYTHLVHRLEFTDPVILEDSRHLKKIAVKQGYTRCNLLMLRDDSYITSDVGIDRSMKDNGLRGIYVNPAGIKLTGFPNGFIGGTMGVFLNTVFVFGELKKFPEGNRIRAFIDELGYSVIELANGPLIDGGGLFFIESIKS